MTTSALNPSVAWAQRKDQIYIQIDIPDVKNEKISLEKDKLHFSGTSAGKNYGVELELYGEIEPARSKYVVKARAVEFVLARKEPGAYWPHILKNKNLKPKWLKADWNKWKDEDELDDDMGFDMSGMSGMSGMPGMSGMDNFDFGGMGGAGGGLGGAGGAEDDSSDDDLPDLESKPDEGEQKADAKKDKAEEEEDPKKRRREQH